MIIQKPKTKILHIIYQLSTGGLENGLVNLINQLPSDQFEHTILSLSYSTDFKKRIVQSNCKVIDLNKRPGPLVLYFPKILTIIKQVKPHIVHTRNLSAVECQIVAWFARVPVRVHSEHGREPHDALGTNKKNQLVRRVTSPFVQRYIALSKELQDYLVEKVGIMPNRITQIYNGVDKIKFIQKSDAVLSRSKKINFITVGRLQAVKSFETLMYAVSSLVQRGHCNIHVSIVGEGVERHNLQHLAGQLKISEFVTFLGEREDVAALLLSSDIFILPSIIEGISNTILEAMSCGLPVVASDVGGNAELVSDQETGFLFQAKDAAALATALEKYIIDNSLISQHGNKGRQKVEAEFSLDKMVLQYQSTYQQLIKEKMNKCVA